MARLRAALSAMEGALLQLDPEGVVTSANPAARQLLGELAGQPLRTLFPLADELLERATTTGLAVAELQHDQRDIRLRVVPVTGGRGFAVALSLLPCRDAEAFSEDAWAPVMSAHLDPSGQILKVTPRLCTWSGYDESDLVGHHFLEFMRPQDHDSALASFERLVSGDAGVVELERVYLDAAGRQVWACASASLIRGDGHRPDRVRVYFRDLTAQKAAEAQAHHELARFRAIFEHSAAGIHVMGSDRRRALWNPAALEMHGFDPALPHDQEPASIDALCVLTVEGHPVPFDECPASRALRGEEVRDLELRVERTDQEFVREIRYSALPVRDASGQVVCAVTVSHDLTAVRLAERALARSELCLKALLDSLPIPVVMVHDREARRMTVNAVHAATLGITTDTNIAISANGGARPGYDVRMHGQSVSQYDSPPVVAAREGRMTEMAEHELVLCDGSSRFMYGRGVPVHDGRGEVIGAFAVFVDITERKRVEEALRASEARERRRAAELTALLEAIPAAVFIAHDPESRLITGSRVTHELLGIPLGSNLSKSPPPDEIPPAFEVLDETGVLPPERMPVQRAARGETLWGSEYELRLPGGEMCYLSGNAVPLLDQSGQPCGSIAAFIDITARRATEHALKQSEMRERERATELATVFEWAPAPLFIALDPECTHIQANHSAQELLGIGTGTNVSTHPSEGEPPPPFRVLRKGVPVAPEDMPVERSVRERRPIQADVLEIVRSDGASRFITGNAVPLLDEAGEPRGALGAFLDVTEQVAAELALRRQNQTLERINAELEEFAYAASHDLKAPLRAVAQLADWLTEELSQGLDENNRERLQLLRSRVVRMDNLINGLLAYARLGYNSPLGPVPVAVGPVLDEVLAQLEIPAGFEVVVEGALPVLNADPLHVGQLFQNLIGNAVRHHDRAEGRVVVRVRDAGEWWRIEVADDGPGIPESQRDQVFKMFTTLRRRDETEHTGIGLALIRKLITRYGGEVGVEENRPRGAVFWATWPK